MVSATFCAALLFSLCARAAGWEVVFWSGGQRHPTHVSESQPLLLLGF